MSSGQLQLDFQAPRVVERFSRKARYLRIEVRPGGDVVLVIPRRVSRADAHAFLHQRDAWVRRTVERMRAQAPISAERERQLLTPKERRACVERARALAGELIEQESARLGLRPSRLRIGDPQTLWGSCGSNGTISLSWRLLMAPPEVFRYVVIHELCHLRYRSHGPRFWGLVARQLPDFEVHRRWLREHGGGLHLRTPQALRR